MKTCKEYLFKVDNQCHRLPPVEQILPEDLGGYDVACWYPYVSNETVGCGERTVQHIRTGVVVKECF